MNQVYEVITALEEFEARLGAKFTREAAKKYLLRKTITGGGTKRTPIKRSWVEKAWKKQSARCKRCGNHLDLKDAVGDHMIALAQGGLHNQNNIAALHGGCNSSKGSNDLVTESKLTGKTVLEQLQ